MRYLLLTTISLLFAAAAQAQEPTPVPTPPKQGPEKPKAEEPSPRPVKPAKPVGETDGQKQEPKKPASKPSEPKVTDTKVEGLPDVESDDLPKGLDPSDIAAMKSAQAMLAAEKRLKEMIKAGKIKDIDRILTFEEISSWPYEDGLVGMPKAIKKLDGKKLMMTGFMLPIDEVENIKEFLLVQSLWSCCYGQPPDINGIVRVVMKGKSRIDYQFDPIKIIGEFKVEAYVEDGYCLDIYQLHADSVEPIK
ncbi:MAG: DUF3299 domain-containing protein [Planctomycetes bacterium]|nr:DUF3299 domain-containing protein [Planctomycetota bacterium]